MQQKKNNKKTSYKNESRIMIFSYEKTCDTLPRRRLASYGMLVHALSEEFGRFTGSFLVGGGTARGIGVQMAVLEYYVRLYIHSVVDYNNSVVRKRGEDATERGGKTRGREVELVHRASKTAGRLSFQYIQPIAASSSNNNTARLSRIVS